MRTLIVTAANEAYAPLLRGLIDSIDQRAPRVFTGLACFDLGLAPGTREWVGRHAAHVVEPGWDLPVGEKLRAEKPELRGLTVRPFLPSYFPGYDAYLWIDADAWVQERYALAHRMSAAFASFARSGNPNHADLPMWPAFNTRAYPTMIFGNDCKVVNDPNREERLSLKAIRDGATSTAGE